MSKSIEEKASAFPVLPVGLKEAGGMRAGDGDEEVVVVVTHLQHMQTKSSAETTMCTNLIDKRTQQRKHEINELQMNWQH